MQSVADEPRPSDVDELVLSCGDEQLSQVQLDEYRAKEEAFAAATAATRRDALAKSATIQPAPPSTSQAHPTETRGGGNALLTNGGGGIVVLNQGKLKLLVAQGGGSPLPSVRLGQQLQLPKSVRPLALRPAQAPALAQPPLPRNKRKPTILKSAVASVDLTEDDGNGAKRLSTLPSSFEKTYPSLVVTARTSLSNKIIPQATANSERNLLDNKIRRILQMDADIFTEHLLQQQLLRCEQFCCDHPDRKLKLGMYSEAARFPHSGGYVWIADCCPGACTSVFRGSIFEVGKYPPAVVLKLLYHWACQTPAANILQWVKVDNNFLKMFFMYLRAVCIAAVDENFKQMGGADKVVEVGVISLGTSSGVGAVREVKVDILGVMDYENKQLRLRALDHLNMSNPATSASAIYAKKFQRILEVLHKWVDPSSTVVADFIIDQNICAKYGFTKMVQSSDSRLSNSHVVDYLRFCVPRMFQNTLNLLSRQLIQQFLDELVWRESWGPIPSRAYDNIIDHLADQTKVGVTDYLNAAYTFIASNPNKNWAYANWRVNLPSGTAAVGGGGGGGKGPAVAELADIALEPYYYGTLHGVESLQRRRAWMSAFKADCRLCGAHETTRSDLNNHLVLHALNPTNVIQKKDNVNYLWSVCGFCMKPVKRLESHLKKNHRQSHVNTRRMCKICNLIRRDDNSLVNHMTRTHCELDMPYRCEVCHFRTSVYQIMLVHFEKMHVGNFCAQCPYCLKVVQLETAYGVELPKNQLYFVQHVQRHALCREVKKCEKCLLCFNDLSTLRFHQETYHTSCAGIEEVERFDLNPNFFVIMSAPIEEPLPASSLSATSTGSFVTLSSSVRPNPAHCCVECDGIVDSSHFTSPKTCWICSHTSCCPYAVKLHGDIYHSPSSQPAVHRPIGQPSTTQPLYCTACPFWSADGNRMAAHLTQCAESGVVALTDKQKAADLRLMRDAPNDPGADHLVLPKKKWKTEVSLSLEGPAQ